MDNILSNMIRVGVVSSVNEKNGTVKVVFDDKDNLVSAELPLLSHEYSIPEIKQQVLCLFLANGLQQGFCLGSFYSLISMPPVQDKNIYYKKFDDGTWIQYDKVTKELNINATGTVNIIGNLKVQGNINATGSIIDEGGNTNNHTHPS